MDNDRLACIGLAAKGFGGGNPDEVGEMAVETVLDLLEFTKFESDYVTTKMMLNQPDRQA